MIDPASLAAAAAEVARQSRYASSAPSLSADSTVAEIAAWLQWCDPNGIHLARDERLDGEDERDDAAPLVPNYESAADAWQALAEMLDQ
jgi:hypothetical protein